MSTPDTLKQRKIIVPVGDGQIIVRRMYHKPMREFIKLLVGVLSTRADLFKKGADGSMQIFSFETLIAKLPEIIASVDQLADFAIAHCTDDAGPLIAEATFPEWMDLLRAALELNCGEELKNSFAGIGAALAPLLATWMPTKPGASPTLS